MPLERTVLRRSLAALLMITALTTTAACAHPHEVPLPGESTTAPRNTRTTSGTSGAADETAAVCREAQSNSDAAVAKLTDKLEDAQSAIGSGNQAAALAAATAAKSIANDWKDDLEGFADRNISSPVRTVLNDGVEMIDELLATPPQSLNADKAKDQVDEFLDDLDAACD